MATHVELTPDRLKMLIVVLRDGKPPHRDRFDPVSAKHRRAQASAVGVEPDVFDGWCEEARVKAGAVKFTVAEPAASDVDTVFVRPMDSPRDAAETYDHGPTRFVKERLGSIPVTHVAEWDGQEALCCLDVDYHDVTAPPREWLENVVGTRVSPPPLRWHFSRSGGLHLFYTAAGDFTAQELAACAALRFRSIDRAAGLELKNVVRGPGPERVYGVGDSQESGAGLIDWLGNPEFDEEARDAWLDSEGMECGKRYEHDKCPIDPTLDAGSRLPVMVSEAGVYCFRCNGKGLTHGSRRPGWAPWPAILGSPSAGELGGLVRNVAHWGHAKWVLTERYGLPVSFARIAYMAALKAYHAGKPSFELIRNVFNKNTEELARVNNLWMTIDSSHTYPNNIQPILRNLPACQYIDPDGKIKADEAAVTELLQTKDLGPRGYKNINVVHGYKLGSVFLAENTNATTAAVVNPTLKALSNRALPRYVPVSKRMPPDEAWALVESVLPRIDRTYIRLLIASFGCAQETMRGLLPVVFASGPSAAGKTAMAQVACGIIGARVGAEATFDPEPAKFRAGIFSGGQQGPVVVLNELLKDATRGRFKLTTREALDFLLNLTPHSESHILYKGPAKMGRLPGIVITDTVLPANLNEETQLARRMRVISVTGRKDEWRSTIARAGITDLHLIRTVSDQMARACDSVMSSVIDDFFSIPMTWDDISDSLGVKTAETSDDFVDTTPWLRELFRLVCSAPPLSERESKLYARGYKKVSRCTTPGEEESDLCAVYSMFVDGPGGDWASSRKLMEKDWSGVLKTDEVVKLDLRGDTAAVYLRFRVGPAKTPTRVNEEILKPEGPGWEALL
jgi:hypothetical protein